MALQIQYVTPTTLTPHPKNPRQGDIGAISESITTNGVYRPVIAQKSTGYILAGNHTYKALCALGHQTIPVTYVDVDEPTAQRIMLADNRTADLGTYDHESLIALLENVDTLDGTGYDHDDLTQLLAEHNAPLEFDSDDTPPPLPETTITKPGDYYQLGPHRLYVGSATDTQALTELAANTKADCIWTDPPYGVDYVGKTRDALTIKNDTTTGLEELITTAFQTATTITRPGAPVYVAHPGSPNLSVDFYTYLTNAGIELRQTLIWAKNTFALGRADYQYQHEPIYYGFTPGGTGRLGRGGKKWYGPNNATTVFEIPKPTRNTDHPTMKPPPLIEAMIKNSVPPAGTILDMFAGSGSTMIAAHHQNMRTLLVEIDPRYADVICARYQNLTGDLPVHTQTKTPTNFLTP